MRHKVSVNNFHRPMGIVQGGAIWGQGRAIFLVSNLRPFIYEAKKARKSMKWKFNSLKSLCRATISGKGSFEC